MTKDTRRILGYLLILGWILSISYIFNITRIEAIAWAILIFIAENTLDRSA